MVTVYDAFKQIQVAIETTLEAAGFINGIKINKSSIKTEKKPIFWFLKVTNADASKKEQYITYSIEGLDPTTHGDGVVLIRNARIEINIYSRKRKIDDHFKAINDAFLNDKAFSNFEMNKFTHDTGLLLYAYSFIVEASVSGS